MRLCFAKKTIALGAANIHSNNRQNRYNKRTAWLRAVALVIQRGRCAAAGGGTLVQDVPVRPSRG